MSRRHSLPSQPAPGSSNLQNGNSFLTHDNNNASNGCASFKEVLSFQYSQSDDEEDPYGQILQSVEESDKKPLSTDEQIEDFKIRVVRLGKCPSELSNNIIHQNTVSVKRRKLSPDDNKNCNKDKSNVMKSSSMSTSSSSLLNAIIFDNSNSNDKEKEDVKKSNICLLYTSPSPRDA